MSIKTRSPYEFMEKPAELQSLPEAKGHEEVMELPVLSTEQAEAMEEAKAAEEARRARRIEEGIKLKEGDKVAIEIKEGERVPGEWRIEKIDESGRTGILVDIADEKIRIEKINLKNLVKLPGEIREK